MHLSAELKDQPIPELIPSSFFFAVVGGLLSKLSQSGDLPLSSIRRDHRACKSWRFALGSFVSEPQLMIQEV